MRHIFIQSKFNLQFKKQQTNYTDSNDEKCEKCSKLKQLPHNYDSKKQNTYFKRHDQNGNHRHYQLYCTVGILSDRCKSKTGKSTLSCSKVDTEYVNRILPKQKAHQQQIRTSNSVQKMKILNSSQYK